MVIFYLQIVLNVEKKSVILCIFVGITQIQMKYIYIKFLTIAITLSACNSSNKSDLAQVNSNNIKNSNPYEVNFNPVSPQYKLETAEIVENYYKSKINTGSFSGGFLMAKNGEVIYEDYAGYSNYQNKDKITWKTPMHVASVGKVITAVSVLRLVDDKKIDLDEKVNFYLEGFPYENITVRNLLNHRSGIPYYGNFTDVAGVWDKKQTITNKDVLGLLKTKNIKLDFKPDTRFTYCNTNYVLLALIVEKVTNKTFQGALKELIFEPLGMFNSFVFDDIKNKDTVTQSYHANNKKMHWDYLDGTYGDKNIYTTPRDLLKLDKALYSNNFLSANLKDQMFKGYSYEKSGSNNYGLGLRMIEPTDETSDKYTFHNGWWRGNKTSYVTLQNDTIAIICFNNKNSALAYKTKQLAAKFGNFPFIEQDKK